MFRKNLLIKGIPLENLLQKSDISIYYQSLCFHEHFLVDWYSNKYSS